MVGGIWNRVTCVWLFSI